MTKAKIVDAGYIRSIASSGGAGGPLPGGRTIPPGGDPLDSVRVDMEESDRGWPPIIYGFGTPIDVRDITPDRDIVVRTLSLDPSVMREIQRLVDDPDVPEETTIYVIPEPQR